MKHNLFYFLVFLSAFLLFSVQPMVGKTVLPMLGGTAQGWLVTLAFFQMALLGGYGLVFLSRGWTARRTGLCLSVLMGVAIGAFLLKPSYVTVTDNVYDLAWFLIRWLGLPLLALGAMAPLLQRLFFAQFEGNPYRLYAVSNIGSFAGLLAYPLLIEPFISLPMQETLWRGGYVTVFALLLMCSLMVRAQDTPPRASQRVGVRAFMHWFALAAVPVSLLSGVTAFITTDMGSFPLLWVIPLALYLATYVVAFNGTTFKWAGALALAGAVQMIALAITGYGGVFLRNMPIVFFVLLLVVFVAVAFACHARAYALRPDAHKLPVFYLALAAGGAFGGLFNAFLVPLIFEQAIELYVVLALAVWLMAGAPKTPLWLKGVLVLVAGAAVVICISGFMDSVRVLAAFTVFYALCVLWMWPPLFFATAAFCLLFQISPLVTQDRTLHQARNYFGTWRVMETAQGVTRTLVHGTTLHGQQAMDDTQPLEPAAYYGRSGPVGDVLGIKGEGALAVVGLGMGQMACYRNDGWVLDFYEIDREIVQIAQEWFRYLPECGADEIIIGDARLRLAQYGTQYDVIVLDAFSSDAIPQHLLTLEAVEVYRQRLKEGGVILFHISNRFVKLDGMLAEIAHKAGMEVRSTQHTPQGDDSAMLASEWLALSDAEVAERLSEKGWETPEPRGRAWRDDHAPLLPVLRIF